METDRLPRNTDWDDVNRDVKSFIQSSRMHGSLPNERRIKDKGSSCITTTTNSRFQPLYWACFPADENIKNLLKMISIKFPFTWLYNCNIRYVRILLQANPISNQLPITWWEFLVGRLICILEYICWGVPAGVCKPVNCPVATTSALSRVGPAILASASYHLIAIPVFILTSYQSLSVVYSRLKTHLFHESFPPLSSFKFIILIPSQQE